MAKLLDRFKHERIVRKQALGLNQDLRDFIGDIIDDGDLEKLAEDDFQHMAKLHRLRLFEPLYDVSLDSANLWFDEVELPRNDDVIQDFLIDPNNPSDFREVRFVGKTVRDVSQAMVNTIRKNVGNVLRGIREGTIEREHARELVLSPFNPTRADLIAIDNTTLFNVAAETGIAQRMTDITGFRFAKIFITREDGRVCPICFPDHGKEIDGINVLPPGSQRHLRCRCGIEWQRIEA